MSTDALQERGSKTSKVWLTVLAVSLLILALCAAALTWTGIQRSQGQDIPAADSSHLTVIARTQQLRETQPGTVTLSEQGSVPVTAPEGTVTRDDVADGQEVASGQVLAVVNQYPVLLLRGDVPAYRQLARGTVGDDVAQLQDSLARLGYPTSDAAGRYDRSTARAVAAMLIDRGFLPRDASGADITDTQRHEDAAMPAGTLLTIPEGTARAVGRCGAIGQRVDGPLCSLRTTALQGRFTPSGQAEQLTEGSAVTFIQDGREISGKIGARDGRAYQILELPADAKAAEKISAQAVLAQTEGRVLTVPLTSITTIDGHDAVEDADGTRHRITTGACARGYCEVTESTPQLSDGTALRIQR